MGKSAQAVAKLYSMASHIADRPWSKFMVFLALMFRTVKN